MANKKIDIYVDGEYAKTTCFASTCRIAIERFKIAYPDIDGKVTAFFQRRN